MILSLWWLGGVTCLLITCTPDTQVVYPNMQYASVISKSCIVLVYCFGCMCHKHPSLECCLKGKERII